MPKCSGCEEGSCLVHSLPTKPADKKLIYADHAHFMTTIDVMEARDALDKVQLYLREDMTTLAGSFLRLAAKKIADANEKLLSTTIRRKKP